MKLILRKLLDLSLATIFASTTIIAALPVGRAFAASTTYDFNSSNVVDLKTNSFNEGADGTAYTYGAGQGLSGSDAIDVNGKSGMWTTSAGKTYFPGDAFEVSGYFDNTQNSGRGGLGISPIDNSTNGTAYPFAPTGLGVVFHGGGGDVYNNGVSISNLSWTGGDIADNAWSFMKVTIAPKGFDLFDLYFQIYPSDANGVLGTLKTEHTVRDITNSNLGAATTMYGYFGTSDQRFAYVDNFAFGVNANSIPTDPVYFPGSGTFGDPYSISTCQQLQDINQLSSTNDKYFVLANDIDCSDSYTWNEGAGFTPIGYGDTETFQGDFNGAGFSINELVINLPSNSYVGLFSVLEGASVHDITFSGSVTGSYDVGGITGSIFANNDGAPSFVTNVHSSATVTGDDGNTGGLVGNSNGNEQNFNVISDSSSTGSVMGYSTVGGIAGGVGYTTITGNYSSGEVSASDTDAGGIAGDAGRSELYENASDSTVSVERANAGGLIGGTWESYIYNSVAHGNVTTGDKRAGGFIGLTVATGISTSYATGDVTGASESGGFVGIFQYADGTGHSAVDHSFSTGTVTDIDAQSDTVNGFVGNIESNSWDDTNFTQNYFNSATNSNCAVFAGSAIVDYAECIGVDLNDQPTRFQVASETPFTVDTIPVWDFDTVWKVQDGNYPCLINVTSSCSNVVPHDADSVTSAQNGSLVSIEESGCSSINSITSQKESELTSKDAGYDYPAGLINFELHGCPQGGTATVSLNFMGTYDASKVLVRKYDARTKAFTTLSGVYEDMSVSATTVEGQPAYRVTYNINDGSSLDQDGVADGTIVDPIGIAASAVAVPNTGFSR